MAPLRFRALACDVEVDTGDAEIAAVLGDLLATYPPASGAPALHYRVEPAGLWRAGARVRACAHPLEAAAAFVLDLYEQLVAACGDRVVLHAAALARGGAALVLTGASGAGKTTLALGLYAAGADYLTEECAAIDRDGTVLGLARPITRLPDDDGPPPAGLERREIRRRLADGRIVRRALLVPPADRIRTRPTSLDAVVLLVQDPTRPTALEALPGVEALQALQPLVMNAGPGALEALVTLAGSGRVHRLRSRSAVEAVNALERLRISP